MHVILGANGVIGHELSVALNARNVSVRQVSRSPARENPSDELVVADLLDGHTVDQAVAGSDVAYLLAGLKYDTEVWRVQWPIIMRNVINACARQHCRLVFLDNVYAYGRVQGAMTEDTPMNPSSRKGEVRAQIATMLLEAMRAGTVEAMIVRSADFYGPHALLSLTHAVVFERLRAGKTPQWVGNPKAVHTFSYTPDVGRAIALLAHSDSAYGSTWHAPTNSEAMTGANFVRLACEAAGRPDKLQVAPGWLLKLMGLWMPVLRENQEMMYQFDHDYRFDSSRIEKAYGVRATSYRDGVTTTWRSGPT